MAMSGPCGGIDGCWSTGKVNVGYYPFVVLHDRVPVRVGPSHDAEVLFVLNHSARFGAQSTRNPNNLDTPPMRPAKNGFVWGYSFLRGTSGWIEFSSLITDPKLRVWADGPAHADFQVGAQSSVKHGKDSSCAGVKGDNRRLIKDVEVYLRYAPHSTPYWYLVHGDVIQERWRGRNNYVCVEVVESKVCPAGTRGWIPYASLSRKLI